jgi:hypothetical protein
MKMQTSNIERPTFNIQLKMTGRFFRSMFDVGSSMFDVRMGLLFLASYPARALQ